MPESFTESSDTVDSPELPDWVKNCENDNASNESNDDFVLPKIAEWADSRKLSGDHSKLVKHIAAEIVDNDLNKLFHILKGRFESIDDVGNVLSVFDQMEFFDQLCKNGKLEHACSFFEQMVLKGMVPRDKTYTSLMEKFEQKAMGKAKKQIEELMLKATKLPM